MSQDVATKRPKSFALFAGLALIVLGLLFNYGIERWNLSLFQELLFPPLAFWVSVTGAVLLVGTFWIESLSPRYHLQLALATVLSLGIVAPYTVLFLILETTDQAPGHTSDWDGLYSMVTSSVEVPQSESVPSRRSVFCQTGMLGMFLTRYNFVRVYGVTAPRDQGTAIRSLAEYRRKAHTMPIRIEFYEKENWIPLAYDKQGKGIGGQRGPEKLLRVATIR